MYDPELLEFVGVFRALALRLGIEAAPLEVLLARAEDPEWRFRLYKLAFDLHFHVLKAQALKPPT